MKTLKFELGQWVSTEDGYGQIVYIRPFYVEDYEKERKDRKNGEFDRYIFICKILCNFEGKIRKSKRINVYTSISKIDNRGKNFVNSIKKDNNEEYINYIFFDDKIDVRKELFLDFILDEINFNREAIFNKIEEINRKLYPSFTYKDFGMIFNEYEMPFKLNNLILHGYVSRNIITLRFDSNLYKVKDKETIFDSVRVIFKID